MRKKIHFFIPGMFTVYGETGLYPAISITGTGCSLMCDHCQAKILHTMPDASTPEKLLELASEFEKKGAVGMLVSGGSDFHGTLPFEVFADALREIVQTTKLHISVHTGFATRQQARLLKEIGINQALIDVIGSDEVAHRVYKLPPGVAEASVRAVFEEGLNVVPHVLVGLDFGGNSFEEKALELVAQYCPKRVVIIALRPAKGTPMEQTKPPAPERVAQVIRYAKELIPGSMINLGCARPVGLHKAQTDVLAIQAGVDGMAVPSRQAYEEAERLGLEIVKMPTCCSLIPGD